MSVIDLIRPDLLAIETDAPAYLSIDDALNANELPWCPLQDSELNRYPQDKPKHLLRDKLAEYYQVHANEILITRGSDEGIDLIVRLFLRPGVDSLMHCPPTFSMYAFTRSCNKQKLLIAH